jgi:hypothetical protein
MLGGEYMGQHKPNSGIAMSTPSLDAYVAHTKTMGWPVFQHLLRILDVIARKHDSGQGVTVANIALRYVLRYADAVVVGTKTAGGL